MLTRLLNLMLFAVTVALIILLLRARQDSNRLRAEADALEARVGGADVADPNKYFVRLLSSDGNNIAWRVYLPATKQMASQLGTEGTTTSSRNVLKQSSVVRWRIREVERRLVHHVSSPFSTSMGTVNMDEKFILENIADCEVSIAGQGDGETFRKDQVVTLLSIQATPRVIERASSFMREHHLKSLLKPYVFRFGLPQAMSEFMSEFKGKTHE